MNYQEFINKRQNLRNKNSLKLKNDYYKNIYKKDIISVGYHEYDKEEIKLELYKGICLQFKGKGLNKKIVLNTRLNKTKVVLNFFFFNPHLFDLMKHN